MAEAKTYSTDKTLYLYTSLTAGSSHIVTATSRLETIMKANRIPFQALDLATDDKARMLWGRRGGKRKLPGLVREGMVLGGIEEIEEWNEYGELRQNLGISTPKPPIVKATAKTPASPAAKTTSTAASPASAKTPEPIPPAPAVPAAKDSTPTESSSVQQIDTSTEKTKSGTGEDDRNVAMRQLGAEAAAKAGELKKAALARSVAAIKASREKVEGKTEDDSKESSEAKEEKVEEPGSDDKKDMTAPVSDEPVSDPKTTSTDPVASTEAKIPVTEPESAEGIPDDVKAEERAPGSASDGAPAVATEAVDAVEGEESILEPAAIDNKEPEEILVKLKLDDSVKDALPVDTKTIETPEPQLETDNSAKEAQEATRSPFPAVESALPASETAASTTSVAAASTDSLPPPGSAASAPRSSFSVQQNASRGSNVSEATREEIEVVEKTTAIPEEQEVGPPGPKEDDSKEPATLPDPESDGGLVESTDETPKLAYKVDTPSEKTTGHDETETKTQEQSPKDESAVGISVQD